MKAETTTLLLPRTVLETGADKDIEYEGTLPDYLPGINRVVRTEANVFCEEAELNDGKVEIKGKALFALLYESDQGGTLRGEKFCVDFTQRFDLGEVSEGAFPTVDCVCSYVGCKTLNPRRFVLRCRAATSLTVKCMQKVDIVSTADCKGAYFKEEKHRIWQYLPPLRRDFNIKETLSLDGLPPINELIYTTVQFLPGELTATDGNAQLRQNAYFKCLYEEEGEEAKVRYIERLLTLSLNIDDPCIKEDSRLSYSIKCATLDATKEMDGFGENRIINLSYTPTLCLECANTLETTLPTDMFFEEYEAETRAEQPMAEALSGTLRHRFAAEKSFEVPELDLDSIMDVGGELQISETTFNDGNLSLKGSFNVNVLGGGKSGHRTKDFTIGFNEALPVADMTKEGKLHSRGQVVSAVAELRGDSLNIRVNGEVELYSTHKEKLNTLVSAEISKREQENDGREPIIIYYPEKGETAWDIGKRYYVNPSKILEANPDSFDKAATITKDNAVLYM